MKLFASTGTMLVVVGVVLCSPFVSAEQPVPCSDGVIQTVCPDTQPVCCAWPNKVVAACCPEGSSCDLNEGLCTIIPIGSNATDPPHKKEGGINLNVGAAAGILAFALIGLFGAGLVAFVLGYKAHVLLERRRRQRQERERQALLARQAQEEAQEDADDQADIDDEDEGLCKICYSQLANCVIMECGHVCCCFACGKKLKQCPICRNPVKKLVRTRVRAFSNVPLSARSSELASVHCNDVDEEEKVKEKPSEVSEQSVPESREPPVLPHRDEEGETATPSTSTSTDAATVTVTETETTEDPKGEEND